MSKQYAALARVSSREQQREGFSLEVQDEALHRYARQQQGEIVKFFRIAETATKPQERRVFKELIAYVKKHAQRAPTHSRRASRPGQAGTRLV